MKIITAVELEAILPHRYPFLLVDRVEVEQPRRRVVGYKRVTANEWWMEGQGHAPPGGTAVAEMPHALVLEALAQTGGALVRDLLDGAHHARAYFMGADRVRLRRRARAGDELRLDVELLHWRRGLCRSRGLATVLGETVLSADLTTIVRGA